MGGEAPGSNSDMENLLSPACEEVTSRPSDQELPFQTWWAKVEGKGMGKKARGRWKTAAVTDRHRAGMSAAA